MLGYYIKSFNYSLWNDKQLSSEWIAWRIILGNIRDYQNFADTKIVPRDQWKV